MIAIRAFAYLQPLDDVSVVFRCTHCRVSSGGIPSRHPPVQDGLLDDVVRFYKQVVHLAVQVNWNGDRPTFGCVQRKEFKTCSKASEETE